MNDLTRAIIILILILYISFCVYMILFCNKKIKELGAQIKRDEESKHSQDT